MSKKTTRGKTWVQPRTNTPKQPKSEDSVFFPILQKIQTSQSALEKRVDHLDKETKERNIDDIKAELTERVEKLNKQLQDYQRNYLKRLKSFSDSLARQKQQEEQIKTVNSAHETFLELFRKLAAQIAALETKVNEIDATTLKEHTDALDATCRALERNATELQSTIGKEIDKINERIQENESTLEELQKFRAIDNDEIKQLKRIRAIDNGNAKQRLTQYAAAAKQRLTQYAADHNNAHDRIDEAIQKNFTEWQTAFEDLAAALKAEVYDGVDRKLSSQTQSLQRIAQIAARGAQARQKTEIEAVKNQITALEPKQSKSWFGFF